MSFISERGEEKPSQKPPSLVNKKENHSHKIGRQNVFIKERYSSSPDH